MCASDILVYRNRYEEKTSFSPSSSSSSPSLLLSGCRLLRFTHFIFVRFTQSLDDKGHEVVGVFVSIVWCACSKRANVLRWILSSVIICWSVWAGNKSMVVVFTQYVCSLALHISSCFIDKWFHPEIASTFSYCCRGPWLSHSTLVFRRWQQYKNRISKSINYENDHDDRRTTLWKLSKCVGRRKTIHFCIIYFISHPRYFSVSFSRKLLPRQFLSRPVESNKQNN